jgi:hypothetical protein
MHSIPPIVPRPWVPSRSARLVRQRQRCPGYQVLPIPFINCSKRHITEGARKDAPLDLETRAKKLLEGSLMDEAL